MCIMICIVLLKLNDTGANTKAVYESNLYDPIPLAVLAIYEGHYT